MNDASAFSRPADEDLLYRPDICLEGDIGQEFQHQVTQTLRELRSQAAEIIVHINTSGGDADAGRSIAAEFRLFQRYTKTQVFMVGKTRVYSAGVTIFASVPSEWRFLTAEAMLLVHERRQHKQLELRVRTH